MKKITVENLEKPLRLDLFVTKNLAITRSLAQKVVKNGATINGKTATPHTLVENGDEIVIADETFNPVRVNADISHFPLNIVFEDEQILVINKPSGISVHPSVANETGTLIEQLLAHDPKIAKVGDSPMRPGIVHRLDKDASGLLVIAKTNPAFKNLKLQFQHHEIKKQYLILVNGVVGKDDGTINFAIGRSKHSGKMAARATINRSNMTKEGQDTDNKDAVTHFKVVERFRNHTLLEVETETGRTHQIRAHFYAFGFPLAGDPLYRKKTDAINHRLFLHSQKLGFTHPKSKEFVNFETKIPTELQAIIDELKI